MIQNLAIDIETYSSADLPRTGVYKYAEAEDFEILLFAYSADDGPVRVVDLAHGEEVPLDIYWALTDPRVLKHAFNAAFERVCLSRWLKLPTGRYLEPGAWRCTQLHAAYFGLPLSLAGVGEALKLQERKDAGGQALIRAFSLPNKDGKRPAVTGDMAEKWAAFKAYCAQDVATESAIRARLERFRVPDHIWKEYAADQRINDRGILVDTALARAAVAMDDAERVELSEELRILTGLENPNSASQLKRWLAENETEVDSLAAKNVRKLLNNAEGRLKRVLELRQGLAKSSTRKYLAMVNAACADGRARGMFQFYGANRTGRWSGRIIQLQNLPREQPDDMKAARKLVLEGDREQLRERFGSVPATLSGLIRTAFIAPALKGAGIRPQGPSDGPRPTPTLKGAGIRPQGPSDGPRPTPTLGGANLIVADYSAIEARVLAWLAGEEWQNELFRSGGDLYCMTAARMFGVPVEKDGENGHLRQKGKVAALACIAEGSPVLTRRGLIPIERVLDTDEVWDGENWVTHGGVIFRGEREVFTYDGLTATPDHLVWVVGNSIPVRFDMAASLSLHLVRNRSYELYRREDLQLRTARVYDILNAGPNHRFTVSGRLVHNCGYGGAVGALKAMGASEMGLSDEELAELVSSWRAANPAITAFWWAVDQAIKTAIVRETETRLDTIRGAARELLCFAYRAGTLMIRLPSRRELVYPGTRMEFSAAAGRQSGRDLPQRLGGRAASSQSIITYFGTDAAKKWTRIESYGPKFVENIVQAVSRDILAEAILRLEKHGYRTIAHVHDEVIIEAEFGQTVADVCDVMGLAPVWAPRLTLRAEGFKSRFYRK